MIFVLTWVTRLIGVILAFLVFYSGIPNLWVRVMHMTALRTVPEKDKVVLTFDDGPDEHYTPRLLDQLRESQVKATFFVIVDKAIRHPDIIAQMLAEGHDVEVHGYKHWMVPFLLPRQTVRQVAKAKEMLKRHFGIEPSWYRPTWGLSNAITLLSRQSRRLRLVTWSVMVGDWNRTSPDVLLHRIMKAIQPGSIIVLHDSDETWGAEDGAPESVIQLIPRLAESIRSRGLEFIPLSESACSQKQKHREHPTTPPMTDTAH